jgi:hypothetical protein
LFKEFFMASIWDFPAKGKVIEVRGSTIIFQPANTTYHLELAGGSYSGPVKTPIELLIRANARKLWTVPSGGNFIAPISGTPRTIQGRVRFAEGQTIVVQAGVPVVITLPGNESGVDLNNGALGVNSLVNAMVMPGVSYELVPTAAAAASA